MEDQDRIVSEALGLAAAAMLQAPGMDESYRATAVECAVRAHGLFIEEVEHAHECLGLVLAQIRGPAQPGNHNILRLAGFLAQAQGHVAGADAQIRACGGIANCVMRDAPAFLMGAAPSGGL